MQKIQFLFLLFLSTLLFTNCGSKESMSISENGYAYLHHVKNGGPTPQVGDKVYFEYTQYFDDASVSTSHGVEPTPSFIIPKSDGIKRGYGQVPPYIDGLKLMSVGDSLSMQVEIDSLPQRSPQYGDAKHIYFRYKLNKIVSAADVKAEQDSINAAKVAQIQADKMREPTIAALIGETLSQYKSGQLSDKIKETGSGLKYVIHEEGNGPKPNQGEKVFVHYYGVLSSNGSLFDNSFKRGSPIDFPLGTGRVIRGWDEGLAQLNKGSKATLFIPANLGYGVAGSPPRIPANSELVFYVELQK